MQLWKKRQPESETPIDPVLRLAKEVLWMQGKLDEILAKQQEYCTTLKELIKATEDLEKRVSKLEDNESQTLEIE